MHQRHEKKPRRRIQENANGILPIHESSAIRECPEPSSSEPRNAGAAAPRDGPAAPRHGPDLCPPSCKCPSGRTNERHVSLLLLNIQSMNPSATSQCQYKHKEIEALGNEECVVPVKFIAVTETWLQPHISDAQVQIENFSVLRSDRLNRTGGGVALYSHINYPATSTRTFDDGTCEGIFTKFPTVKMCIFVLYRPPSASKESFGCLLQFIERCVTEETDDTYQLSITGDLNFPFINWENASIDRGSSTDSQQSASSFLNITNRLRMAQYITQPTRGNNILDIFSSNNESLVKFFSTEYTSLSDHRLVRICLDLSESLKPSPCLNVPLEGFASLDFNRADFENLNRAIAQVDWRSLQDICSNDQFPILFSMTLFQLCEIYVPKKKSRSGKPKKVNALRRQRKRINKQLERAKRARNARLINSLDRQVSLLTYKIKEAYMHHRDNDEKRAISKIKLNPKAFYAFAKSKSSVRSRITMMRDKQGDLVTQPKLIANALQTQFSSVYSTPQSPVKDPEFPVPDIQHEFTDSMLSFTEEDFISAIKEIGSNSAPGPDDIPAVLLKNCAAPLSVPLFLIWSSSFSLGQVPECYRTSIVCPIHKKGDKVSPENYRPISLTSHVIKTFERIIRNKMVHYLETNNILSKNQHGFRSGRSTLSQLLSHINDIITGLCNEEDTDSIYLDYEKAFDKVDHNLLIAKLKRYKFHPQIVSWISSFLSCRSQTVLIGNERSFSARVKSGVPQGTVLGPILFLVFINDLENVVGTSTVRFFADDTRISHQIRESSHHDQLQVDLNNILKWSSENNMRLHEQKFELLVHEANPRNTLHQLPFSSEQWSYVVSDEVQLAPTDCLRDLGLQVTNDLSWSTHIQSILKKGRSVSAWVLSVFKARDRLTMLTLYKSLVRSTIEYCCPIWHPSKISDIDAIEDIQRDFTRNISGYQQLTYWQRLKRLGLMSLQRRRERFIILNMWKILHEKMPNDLNVQFRPPSRLGIQAIVPNIPRNCSRASKSLFDASFAVVGPTLWNCLPSYLTTHEKQSTFKNKLTDYLRGLPDEPPVHGYQRAHDNTLVVATRYQRVHDNTVVDATGRLRL